MSVCVWEKHDQGKKPHILCDLSLRRWKNLHVFIDVRRSLDFCQGSSSASLACLAYIHSATYYY